MPSFFETDRQFGQWLLILVAVIVFCILVQTYLMPYGLAVLALSLIWVWWQKPLQIQNFSRQLSLYLLLGSVIFGLGLLINLSVTQNLPATIQAVMKWLVGSLVFVTAILTAPTKTAQPRYWLGLLSSFLVLGSLSLLTWVVPSIRVLPDMNFLYANFGHNHFSSVLLVVLPWIILVDQIYPSRYWRWGVMVWTVWLVSTFSRLGIAVGIFELFVLASWLRSNHVWWRFLTRWIGIVLILLMGWGVMNVLGYQKLFCAPDNYFSSKICKQWQSEQRPEYWRQALVSIQKNPWFGTGLGTFDQTSLQYRKAPGSYSSHVHNDYLEWVAEAGWFGVVLSSALWLLWWFHRPRTIDWFARATWLSVGALLAVGLFEFDLQFVVFLFVVLIGLGWLIGWWQKVGTEKPSVISFKILRGWFSVVVAIVLFWASGYLWLNLDWQYGAGHYFEKYGQYYQSHSLLVVQRWNTLGEAKKIELLKFWQADFRVLDFLIREQSEAFTNAQKEQLMTQFYIINPWSRQYYDLVQLQFDKKDFIAGRQTLEQTKQFVKFGETNLGVTLADEADALRWQQARHYRNLAEWEIAQGQVFTALTDLATAAEYEPWILNDETAAYCNALKLWVRGEYNSDPVWQTQWSQALEVFDVVDPRYLGSCGTNLSLMALEQLKVQLRYDRCHDAECQIWQRRARQWSNQAPWTEEFLARLRIEFPTQEF